MKSYYRVMLGKQSVHADECFQHGFIGTDFGVHQDLTGKLPEDWRSFNREFIPIYLKTHPDKTRIGAGLSCGFLWTVSKGIREGDIVLCPDGTRKYRVGEVTGGYYYQPNEILFHRRKVRWYDQVIERSTMSEALQASTGSIGTVSNVTKYAEEIEKLIAGKVPGGLFPAEEAVEDPAEFAMEKHLEDFLVQNWKHTDLGKNYDVYEDENGTGQQYPSDTGPIDILAVSKDKKELLVVELKKGRASDVVVGQIQRYMGYAQEVLAADNQKVRGVIIALEDDLRIRRALAVTTNIEFFRYQVSFSLMKA